MTPTDHQPAELFDLDRYVGQTFPEAQFDAMERQWLRVLHERLAAQERANHAMQEERARRATVRKLYRLVVLWVVVSALVAGVAFYLRAHGE